MYPLCAPLHAPLWAPLGAPLHVPLYVLLLCAPLSCTTSCLAFMHHFVQPLHVPCHVPLHAPSWCTTKICPLHTPLCALCGPLCTTFIAEYHWLAPITSFQMLNSNQSLYSKIGLISLKGLRSPLHPFPKSSGHPNSMTKLTLKEPAIQLQIYVVLRF